MLLKSMMEQIKDPDLRVMIIWQSIATKDVEAEAKNNQFNIDDSRVSEYWTSNRELSRPFGEFINWKRSQEPWDFYTLHSKSAMWGEKIPKPDYSKFIVLREKKFVEKINKLLAE